MRCSKCPAEFEVFPAACPLCGTPVVLAGRYQIKGLIGRGGMGEVYLAYDQRLTNEVALKRLPARFAADPDLARALTKEARLLARLTDDCIVRMFDLAETPEGIFLILEYICGPSLQDMLKTGYRLPVAEVLRVFQFVCKGLSTAHAAGIIHRDLKPGNFLVSLRGEERQRFRASRQLPANLRNAHIKLADFGIAKAAEASTVLMTSGVNMASGTPAFMAPEQFRGEMPSPQTDVYALGVIAFQLLAGRLPFVAGDLAYCHQFVPPPALPDAPAALNAVVQKAMAKLRAERYRSPGEFYEAMVAAIEHPPDASPPPVQKEVRRPVLTDGEVSRGLRLSVRIAFAAIIVLAAGAGVVRLMRSDPPPPPPPALNDIALPAPLELHGAPSVDQLPPIIEEARGRVSLLGITGPRRAKVAWKFAIPRPLQYIRAIGVDGTVYLDPAAAVRNGRLVWAYATAFEASFDQLDGDGRIWLRGMPYRHYCFNRDGQGGLLPLKGSNDASERFPEPAKDEPFVPSCVDREIEFSNVKGRPKIDLDNDCTTKAIAPDRNLLVATNMPTLYCIRPNGTLAWKTSVSCIPRKLVAGEAERAWFACADGSAQYIDRGSVRWKFSPESNTGEVLIDSHGSVYLEDHSSSGQTTGHLRALTASGETAWKLDFPGLEPQRLYMDVKGRLYVEGEVYPPASSGMVRLLLCVSD